MLTQSPHSSLSQVRCDSAPQSFTVLGMAVAVIALLVFAPTVSLAQNSKAWRIQKTSWSQQDEKNFEAFVVRLGEKVETRDCSTVRGCMKSDANIYAKSDPDGLNYKADCADFPYFIRGYFAWKNGLPFSLATGMSSVTGGGDTRYSSRGNTVASRFSVVSSSSGDFPNALKIFNEMIPWQIDSGNFRVNYKGNDEGPKFVDFYPVAISRESIKPGTVLYDPNGHVTVIYKVTDDGKAYYIDAHPDNSLTSGVFSIKFVRSHPGQGAGFKRWRPLRLEGATQNNQGYYIGGQITPIKNAEISDYSTEQFFGVSQETSIDWTDARYSIEGKGMGYYDYVRQRLAKGELRINPTDDYRNTLSDLCMTANDRINAVDIAIRNGLAGQDHPERLPENIYGTSGDWETYSTPSRDAQLKVSFRDLIDQAVSYFDKLKSGDPQVVYSGTAEQLAADLLDVYKKESASCEMTYLNSNGRSVTLNLDDLQKRLFKISFDPYHCIELRWGATSDDELASCRDSSNKRKWYAREQQLRNQHLRRYDIRMDFTLDDLSTLQEGVGREAPLDIDVLKYLEGNL